ncbi:hypothetical protein PG985_000052 [Apiospora marii]|uniref:uncharacterized protein n=1 Tax=Apiospora marii TaxID=335849 RepID=UPI00313171C1
MRQVPGAEKVVFFDYTLRRARSTKLPSNHVKKIHIDQSPKGAVGRAKRHLEKEDWETISNGQKRLRIINFWKPLVLVRDHPLALADSRTLLADDLVNVRHAYPDYIGETLAVRHREGQEFWYWSGMTPKDVLLFQCFDSQQTVDAKGLSYPQYAHGPFELREDGSKAFTRVSIEVRCLVVCEL